MTMEAVGIGKLVQRRKWRSSSWHRQWRAADAVLISPSIGRHRPLMPRSLVDVMLSEHRDLAAAKAFFRSAKTVTSVTPDRVTTDGHDAYPRAIRTELRRLLRHRTSCYLNNRLEQDTRPLRLRRRYSAIADVSFASHSRTAS